MRNEYGESLDRNGYAISILNISDNECFLCERTDRALQRHEVFHGAYRTKSKALGLWVCLCDECHDRLHHKNAEMDSKLKVYAQKIAMFQYNWTIADFRKRFGKNYLEEDDES